MSTAETPSPPSDTPPSDTPPSDTPPPGESVQEPGKEPWREPAFLRVWAQAEIAIANTVIVIMFVTVLWQVISRYVPLLAWPEIGELGNYSLVVLTFIMVGYLIGRNGHITIQIIDYVVKGRAFVAVKAISAVFTAVICAALAYESLALIQAYPTRVTAALEIPIWILYAVPLAGFASGVVRSIIRIFTADRPEPVFETAEAS